MKKVIEKSNVSRLLYELLKLQKTDKYVKEWANFGGTGRPKKVLQVYFRLLGPVKAIALAENDLPVWERTDRPSVDTDSETIEFEKCVSDHWKRFDELTKKLFDPEWTEVIRFLFTLFPKDLVAVWKCDDSILINELFLRDLVPCLVGERELIRIFQIQIEGEDAFKKEFEKEKTEAQKDHNKISGAFPGQEIGRH